MQTNKNKRLLPGKKWRTEDSSVKSKANQRSRMVQSVNGLVLQISCLDKETTWDHAQLLQTVVPHDQTAMISGGFL